MQTPPPLERLPAVLLALVCFQPQLLMNCLWLVICQLITERSTCPGGCLRTLPFVLVLMFVSVSGSLFPIMAM